jgi:peptide methionine sulfoxide reductase msrA/msrB
MRILLGTLAALFLIILSFSIFNQPTSSQEKEMKYNLLTPEEERVILHKGTETPFTGKYTNHKEKGTYVCKRCNAPLYESEDKFDSHCGWPSFDDEIKGAVKRVPDADGFRTEIICNNCGAHLGHVFEGEGFTDKNVRHCVNSISMNFVAEGAATVTTSSKKEIKTETAYFAGGCFWGTEHLFKEFEGVVSTRVGYMGGNKKNPTYKEVCNDNTGHAEAVEVVFDPNKTNYEKIARYFFEIHDPTQADGQGPDIGDQYRSAVFYTDENQKQAAEKLIKMLKDKGFKAVTEVTKADTFWEAEDYHQDYYEKTGKAPYCHFYQKKF